MDTTMVEAVPAVSLFAVAVVFEVTSRAVVEHVVLAGDVVDTLDLDVLEKLGGGVELLGLGQVGNVAGVNDEGRPRRYRIDLLDGAADGAGDVRVGFPLEADVAIAQLDEGEAAGRGFRSLGLADEAGAARNAAAHRPQDAGAGPRHALEGVAPGRAGPPGA